MTLSTSAVAVCCWRAFPQFLQQPRVLDRDDGLACETSDQFDLLVGERSDFLPVYDDRTDQIILLEHRHAYKGTCAAKSRWRARIRIPRSHLQCRSLLLSERDDRAEFPAVAETSRDPEQIRQVPVAR